MSRNKQYMGLFNVAMATVASYRVQRSMGIMFHLYGMQFHLLKLIAIGYDM